MTGLVLQGELDDIELCYDHWGGPEEERLDPDSIQYGIEEGQPASSLHAQTASLSLLLGTLTHSHTHTQCLSHVLVVMI